jgi:hypothetical protein
LLLDDGFVVVGGWPAFIGTDGKRDDGSAGGEGRRISFPLWPCRLFGFCLRCGCGCGLILVAPSSIAICWML